MIYLTDRQQEAKERMEDSLKMTHRFWFNNYWEFNEYMEFLIRKIKKKISFDKAIQSWKINYKDINEKKQKDILSFYNKPDKLANYAINYIQKYFPSSKKLLNKLIEKSKNEELSKEILNKMYENWIQQKDEVLCLNYLNHNMAMWKNYSKIKTLLQRKLFDTKLIDSLIEKKKEEVNYSLLDPFSLERKILTLLNKWKSEFYIKNKFVNTEYDRILIDEILEKINFDNTDIIVKEISKLKNKSYDNKKIIQKMYSKWYNYNEIKEFL